jgi:hypothetical protein
LIGQTEFQIVEWKLTGSLDDRDSRVAFVLELHVSGVAENKMLIEITTRRPIFIWLKSRLLKTVSFKAQGLPLGSKS